MGFPGSSAGKESACNTGDMGSIPGLGRSSGEGDSYPLQYSGLENSMDCIVHGVTQSGTRLSNFHFHSRWPTHWSFCFSISPSNKYSGLISFRIDWFDLSPRDSLESSTSTPQFKSINSLVLSFLYSPTFTSIHDHRKSHSLT